MKSLFAELSRRQFVKSCAVALSILGLEHRSVTDVAEAAEKILARKAPILWVSSQTCGSCCDALIHSRDPGMLDLIFDTISLRAHPRLGSKGGIDFYNEIEQAQKLKYILIVDGSIPIGEDERLSLAGFDNSKPITTKEFILRLSSRASAIIALGTCASFGGINRNDDGTVLGIRDAFGFDNIINIPGCAPNPDWLVLTLLGLVMEGKPPKLDDHLRPTNLYGHTIHDRCQRRGAFDDGDFVEDLEKDSTKIGCLYKQGCKGPVTFGDCPSRLFNSGTSWCVASGGNCVGCTQPEFMRDLAPLHHRLADVNIPFMAGTRVAADRVGMAAGIATAAGIAIHFIGRLASKSARQKDEWS